MNATAQLPYLTAVINQSLRMYPSAALDLVRIVPPEGWQIADQYVAGGVSATPDLGRAWMLTREQAFVEVQPWSINHSSDSWTDPWKFNPDRFLRDEDAAKKAGSILEALQPFSRVRGTASDASRSTGHRLPKSPDRARTTHTTIVLHLPRCASFFHASSSTSTCGWAPGAATGLDGSGHIPCGAGCR